jgi:protein tyrosine phosphatase (PTP) superfamily phosphohydrolase (DUF442 family)
MREMLRRGTVPTLLTLTVTVVACAAWVRAVEGIRASVVIPSEVFRSPQPSTEDLRGLARQLRLKTIVNLRGENPDARWYHDETRAAAEFGLRMVSLSFETFDRPSRTETLALVETLESSPRPILLHCWSGRDRSNWAAGVARLLEGGSLDDARGGLTALQGHVCEARRCPLHGFFDEYERWLDRSGLRHDGPTFSEWVRDEYYPEPYRAHIATGPLPGPHLRVGDTLRLTVVVGNDSRSTWTAEAGSDSGIRLGARLLGPFDRVPENPLGRFRSRHGAKPRDVWRDDRDGEWAPGELRAIEVAFDVPDEPGIWLAQLDMVDERIHWFSDLGGPGLILPVRVTP